MKIKELALCQTGSFELFSHLTLNFPAFHSGNSKFLAITPHTVYLYMYCCQAPIPTHKS
jgi:hypothetical protein